MRFNFQETPPESPNQTLEMEDDDAYPFGLDENDVEEVTEEEYLAGFAEESGSDEGDGFDELATIPPRDDADFVFKKHTGSVFCCNLDPKNGNLAVTGAEDDKAYVWEIHGGQVLFECPGHKDSVMAAEFNHDSSYVATGDMSGIVQAWRVSTQTLAWSTNVGDISWLKWHHGANVLLCGVASGEVYMWKIPSGECKILPGHGMASDIGAFMPDGRRAAVGYSDGCVKLFDLKTGTVQVNITAGDGHSTTVSSLDVHSDNNLIVTGGGDGKVNLIKTQSSKVIASFNCDENASGMPEWVEVVGFCKDSTLPLVAAGTLTGKLYIWDISKQTLRHKCEQESGISRLLWDKHSPVIYTGGLDGIVRIYDARSGKLQSQLLGHRDNILDIAVSVDGNTLLSAGDDRTARVFSINSPDR